MIDMGNTSENTIWSPVGVYLAVAMMKMILTLTHLPILYCDSDIAGSCEISKILGQESASLQPSFLPSLLPSLPPSFPSSFRLVVRLRSCLQIRYPVVSAIWGTQSVRYGHVVKVDEGIPKRAISSWILPLESLA